jgi:CIC family chloride channel protein
LPDHGDSAANTPASLAGWTVGMPRIGLFRLSLLGFAVGVVGGLGAFAFRELIGLVHNILFLHEFAFAYDSSLFTPAHPWGPFVALVPVIGALGVTFIVMNFAPEAKGHGVPEVMDAIYYNAGLIRPIVAAAKSVASALAIGSGASVGREGPIIQIGAAFGSTLGQIVRLTPGQRITLVAAGAGAGIAATFNTPIGGVLFAIELMLPEVSVNTFLPVAIATGTATFIGRIFFGPQPAFSVPALVPLPQDPAAAAVILVLYLSLGALTGVAAAGFIRALHLAEDLFDRIPGPYLRHAAGMFLVGLLIYALYRGFGQYFVEGVGYATIQAILNGQMAASGLLLILFLCKIAATSTSLGSGSSGGIFSPSLFMGASLGGAFAGLVGILMPALPINLPSFAMVGMGAMVGGGTGAAMTAVAMIFEMTRDYAIVLPLILAVAASLGVRRLLSRENIYTAKLVPRGHPIPKALHANMFLVRRAAEVMQHDFLIVPAETGLDEFLRREQQRAAICHVVVIRGEHIAGVQRINTGLRRGLAATETGVNLGEVARHDFILVREDAVVFDVIARMWRRGAAMALVVRLPQRGFHRPRPGDVVGIITKEDVADAVAASVQVYPR